MSARIETSRFRVEGMDCASCASKVDTAVRRLPGVEDVSVSVVGASMTVKHTEADLGAIARKVSSLGYKTAPLPARGAGADKSEEAHDHAGHDHGPSEKPKRAETLSGMHGHDHG